MMCGTLGAAAVLACGGSGPAHAILVQPPLVAIGKASYSLYLWHWPVIVFAEFFGLEGRPAVLTAIIASLTLVSYFLLEKPTRRNRRTLPFIGLGYAATLACAVAMAFSSGAYDTSRFEPATSHSVFYDLSTGKPGVEQPSPGLAPPSWTIAEDAYAKSGILLGPSAEPDVVVLGDSHGLMWCETIRTITEQLGATTSFFCATATPPFPGVQLIDPKAFTPEEHRRFDDAKKAAIARWKPAVVVLCGRWSFYREEQAADFVDYLAAHSGHVLLLEQPPENEADRRKAVQWLCFKNVEPGPGERQYLAAGNTVNHTRGRELVRTLAARHSNCSVVPLAELYLRGQEVFMVDGRQVLYIDGDHISDQATQFAVPALRDAIAEHLRRK